MRTVAGSMLLVAALAMSSVSIAQDKDTKHHKNESFVPGPADENRIAKEVRHQLVMLPFYSIYDDLGFTVNGGTVTLEGAVVRPTLKSDSENVTKRVEGVTNVVNNIEVLPLSPMDNQIRAAETRAIYGNGTIGTRYGNQALPPIHIIVKNGHVTLEGVVANDFDKNFINVRARGVPNVFSVTNNLMVEKKS